jgi:hypothetical protein
MQEWLTKSGVPTPPNNQNQHSMANMTKQKFLQQQMATNPTVLTKQQQQQLQIIQLQK